MSNVTIKRQQETELPQTITVTFINKLIDYQQGTQDSRRAACLSDQKVQISLPIVMDDHIAKNIAERLMYAAWTNRDSFTFTLARKYSYLEPTDVITLYDTRASLKYLIRITHKAESRSGEIQFEGVAEHRAAYQQNAAAAQTSVVTQAAPVSAATNAAFLDLPALRDSDIGAGYYMALAGAADPWAGGGVLQSLDSGGTYTPYTATTVPATMGTLSTVLGDGITTAKDTVNTFTLFLDRGELATTTDLALANGANMAAIRTVEGWEVMQFQQAILQPLVAPETRHSYNVSGLYRGKFGTEWATVGHAIGDRFVLLDTNTVQRVPLPTPLLSTALYYKVYTTGQSVGSATVAIVTNHGVALKPYSVVNVITSGLPGDLTISWTRRYRVAETVQPTTYEVEIWDSTFTTLKHTFTGVPDPTVVYTAAQALTDFGTASANISFKIFQISPVVGRGYETRGTAVSPPPVLAGQTATTATGTTTPNKGPALTGQSMTVFTGTVTKL